MEYSLGPLIPFWRGGLSVSNMERKKNQRVVAAGGSDSNDHTMINEASSAGRNPRRSPGGPSPVRLFHRRIDVIWKEGKAAGRKSAPRGENGRSAVSRNSWHKADERKYAGKKEAKTENQDWTGLKE